MQLSDRIGRRMKLHDLHVLMAVVQAGSMSKAAALLNTTQPAISRSIAELERTVGVRLLDRNPQGVEPTEYGRALLDGGAAVFDDLRQAVKNIEFLADPAAGEVRIGCNPFLAASFVSAVIDRLSRRYPRIVFHLVTAQAETLHRELSERNVDLLIARRFGPIADERLGFEFLFDELICRRGGRAKSVGSAAQDRACRTGERTVGVATAGKRDWVGRNGSLSRQRARLSSRDCGHRFPRGADESAGDRALSHDFPGFRIEISHQAPGDQVLPVELPMARVPIGIVTLKNRTLSPVAQLFIEHAREVAKPLAKRKR